VGLNIRIKNETKLNINSEQFLGFKRFILELKKLNNEYIEFKNDNKNYLGKPKKFDEFISENIEKLEQSDYVESDDNKLKGIFFTVLIIKEMMYEEPEIQNTHSNNFGDYYPKINLHLVGKRVNLTFRFKIKTLGTKAMGITNIFQ
jgi:lipopolysaccharide export system protein LptA